MEFIPFELKGNGKINDVVDIGDGGDETGESFFGRGIVHDAATSLGGDARPFVNVFIALFGENLRHLPHDDFLAMIDARREAKKGVN